MSAETDYLRAEGSNTLRSLAIINGLLRKPTRSVYETIALGKLLQDLYSGLERVLRTLLAGKGVHTERTAGWHKDLLLAARQNGLVSDEEFAAFGRLLLFRHLEVHGYGFTLDDERLVEIAQAVTDICRRFLARLPL